MSPDIKEINLCISAHYCTVIHGILVGKVPSTGINKHIYYINMIKEYIDKQYSDPVFFTDNLKEILKRYNGKTGDISSLDMIVNTFVENYTFPKVYANIDYVAKLKIFNHIMFTTLIKYFEWLCCRDEKCFFGVELTPEQKQKFSHKLVQLIKLNGTVERFKMYNNDKETVPMKLFLELKKQYDKLKKRLDED